MRAHEIFVDLGISEDHAAALHVALATIASIPEGEILGAIKIIEECEAVGPFFDPTFFVRNPDAWENGRNNKALFHELLRLKRHLPDFGGRDGE